MPKKKNDTPVSAAEQPSLLEQALAVGVDRTRKDFYTEAEIELALGWVDDKVTLSQVTAVILKGKGKSNSSPYAFLARALKQTLRESRAQ